jgi:hypothetical protein
MLVSTSAGSAGPNKYANIFAEYQRIETDYGEAHALRSLLFSGVVERWRTTAKNYVVPLAARCCHHLILSHRERLPPP